ncbi:MAG: hypothetical protein JNL81_07445 [Hyphomonadaceae bacterium]|nr:hypothetical protein [Hyphomonadaceae bacterium]
MTYRPAPQPRITRLAACFAAAGFLFLSSASAQTALPPPNYGTADARQDRIQELEDQLRATTADNERLQYELMQAQREVRRLQGLVDQVVGVNQQLSEGQTPPAAGAAPAANASATPSTLNDAQRRQTGTLGTMPADAAPPAAPRDPAADYARARQLLAAGQYAEAEVALGDYLQANPNAENAADARFWFAFTLAARNNHTDAAANFLQYLQAAPNAPRAPEAQVRLGMALIGMGRGREGCGAFANLPRRYPNAARNVRDLAAREARAANCPA